MSDGRTIPVIADEYVDREFGTGALKITPAHDVNDYAIGQRCNLDFIVVMNRDATMAEISGKYAGMDRFECRKKLWADMEAAGFTLKTEPYTNRCATACRLLFASAGASVCVAMCHSKSVGAFNETAAGSPLLLCHGPTCAARLARCDTILNRTICHL
jgi:tRNA synthetases class I (I, L, M and V)